MTAKHGVAALALSAVVAALATGGCQSSDLRSAMAGPAATEAGAGSTPVALVCATEAKPVPLPESFPASAALPAGYVVTAVEARSAGRTVVTAVSPKPLRRTLTEMRTAFSTRGWTASQGEVEERDAESNFSGHGLRGRWTVRELPDCSDNTSVSILIGE